MNNKDNKIYAVARGKKPGIYSHWDGDNGAKEQVHKFPHCRFKGFFDYRLARQYIRLHNENIENIPIFD